MYRLINARPSPYGRKVAVTLHEKNIPFETIYDLPWADAVETRQHSPLEQLPILLVEGEEPVYDSSFILQWIEARHPEPPLLPPEPEARIAALRLQMLGERLMEIGQSLIFEGYRPQPSLQAIDRGTRKILGGLAELERLLARGPSRSSGDPIHLGHIAIGTTLLVWEFVVAEKMSPDIDALIWRGRYPSLTALVTELEERPSFQVTQPQSMAVDIGAEVG
jgi:glutathione S-transferase